VIIYVESNFVLELARRQEEGPAAEEILQLAEAGTISLAFPIFSMCEPFSTLMRYGSDRARLVQSMRDEVHELGRLEPHKDLAMTLQPVLQTLLSIARSEMDALETTVERMLRAGRAIQLTGARFAEARTVEKRFGLSAQDAMVYASVLGDLKGQPREKPKCFVSRNSRDFDDPAIVADLRSYGCRYIAKLSDALLYIRSEVRAQ